MKIKPEINIFTSRFPYGVGEHFAKEEIEYLCENWDVNILPMITLGEKSNVRDCRGKVKPITKCIGYKERLKWAIISFFDVELYREITYFIKNYTFTFKAIIKIIATFSHVKKLEKAYKFEFFEKKAILYTYWNDVQFYALSKLKMQGYDFKLFSRIHGFDLYKELRESGYIPFKDRYINNVDLLFCLSDKSIAYITKNYSIDSSKLKVARIGVSAVNQVPKFIDTNRIISILSVSFCSKIKDLPRAYSIVKYISEFCDKKIVWHHIGDGDTLAELKLLSDESKTEKLECYFWGYQTPEKIADNYRNTQYDFFLNTSKSEGTPLTIMEAMSYGIPAVGPDIGGISEIIADTGLVFEPSESDLLIAKKILALRESEKYLAVRSAANARVNQFFNKEKNYHYLSKLIEQNDAE